MPFKLLLIVLSTMAILGAKAWGTNLDRSASVDMQPCRHSDLMYESDVSLMRQKSFTHFRLMTSRYVEIVQAARGYRCTGATTIAFDGHNYFQAGMSDDPGIAMLIPQLSKLTGLSFANTFDLVEVAIISLGLWFGFGGFCCMFTNRRARLMGVAVFVCLGIAETKVGDVYIFQISPLIAGIPWVVHFAEDRKSIALTLSAAMLAFCCSWCSFVRIGTTLICLVFLTTMIVGRFRLQRSFLPLLFVFLACLPAMLAQRQLIAHRNGLLVKLHGSAPTISSHPIWHAIYAGLAFVPNHTVPAFDDIVAIDKVRSIDPAAVYTSSRYEAILRQEVFRIARHEPTLLLENLAAKSGVVVILALVLLFPSRHLVFAEVGYLWLDLAFLLAIGVSAMNSVLVVPKVPYLLTFVCLTFLYSSIKLCKESSTVEN